MRVGLLAASAAKLGVVFFLLVTLCYGQVSVLTQRNDPARDGLNANETALTLSSVSVNNFGKLFNFPVDGYLFAQPLYVAGVAIPGNGTHNVIYAATMHDSVYAYDADGLSLQPLWAANLAALGCPNGFNCSSVPSSANYPGTPDILPEIGILSTPVIDPAPNNTLYVVAKTQEISGSTTNYVYRLHALDITTGAERAGSPVAIQGQVQGTGAPNNGGFLVFSPQYSLQRPALALVNSNIYMGFGSSGDFENWHGWIFGYDKSSLSQTAVFSPTPNGSEGHGGVWMHGNGLASDTAGNLYFSTGNGAFDGSTNFGDSFLKLATPGLTVADYFTPYNQQALDNVDLDIASGGLALLPDSAGTAQHPHIMIGCGKNGAIYVVDRDNLGQFNSSNDNAIIQELLNVIGNITVNPKGTAYVEICYSSPAYWQGQMYIGGIDDSLKMFDFSNGLLSKSAVSQSATTYQFPGTSPSVSANGASNGIVWTIENSGNIGQDNTGTTAILHAYDATNLSSELYNSAQVASDAAGAPVKFTVPTIANGKVYVGTQNSVAVYGLVSGLPQASAPSFSIPAGTYSSSVTVTITEATAGTTIYYTTDGSTPTTSSNVYTGPITISLTTTLSAMAAGGGYRASPITTATYIIVNGTGITFIQVNSATPQTSQTQVSVPYPQAQLAGDLNLVVVGWNDTTATVQSVKDSGGNNYSLAIGPTSGTALRQSIYYAPNIVGGANTVTVTFSQAAVDPDVRILEYRGVSAVDKTAGASGSSTTASSGSATTTSANELIFGANMVYTLTGAAGSGFTSRIITNPDGDIAEDEVVTTTGSNSATASLTSSGPWVMQMVTFAAVSGPAPTVSSVSPNSGATAGGTAVTITGTNFASGATVTFGGAAATSVVVVNSTTITATTPAGSAGAVTVTVTVNGQSGSLPGGFTYVVVPTVSSVSPNNGPAAGGTAVTVTGTNFASGATVTFGGAAATSVVVVNSTTITATTPAGSTGAVTVTVTVNGQSGSLANGFTYVVPPTVSSVSPNTGSTGGGTAVTVTGTNFASGATVTFGGAAATSVVVVNSTTITATTPAGSAGAVTVTVTVSGQSGSLTNGFTYIVSPSVSSVSPNTGSTAGGTGVTITGTNFAAGATVTFGGTAATNVVVVNGTTITATTPAHAAGAVTVTVTVNSQSGSLTNGFTYLVPPTVSSVSPNTGSTAGGTAVTITGTNFAAGATVTFGGAAATSVVVVNSTTITATTPAGSAGAVTVTVTVSGQSGSLPNGFTYVVVPTVSSISPNNGPVAGGTAVTITGTNFAAGATVTFGGTAATNVVVVNSTTITATTPAGSAGAVTVTVTVSGQSGSLTNGFTYNGAVAISFAQVASATPQSSTATVTVAYPGAQTAGDLNVVVVGWNDTTATVQSVKDSGGNNYSLAIGPTSGTALRQSIYYAPNIVGGANTVTVTFSQAAVDPDVRILEYRGVSAVDKTAGASGSSTTASSGSATTTSANELIFGANMVYTLTGAAGSGFTSRIITNPDGDIAEDEVVTTTGSNSATASLTSSGPWVMQMVTFAAVSGPAPTVSSVSPNSGATAGGTAVTITGTNFASGATVTFGGAAATSVVVVNSTTITATTPAGSAGAVTVTVTVNGQSGSLPGGFTYVVVPTVSSVSPNNGPAAGGTAVTVTGTNFASGATVTFGGAAATSVVVVNSTTITATTPAGSTGAVTVTVTVSGQSGSLANGFTYVVPPTVSSVSPNTGSTGGGTAVTVTGTNFASGATVTFGGAAATSVVVVNSTTITATTPAGSAGAVTVTVTVSGQSGSLTNGFTYIVSPSVSSVSPNTGSTAGGTGVTITGTNFAAGATVTFGGTAATNVVVVNGTTITATTPAHAAGAVTVTVTVNSQSGSLTNGFTYLVPPTVSSVSPNTGSTAGGTAVTITGTNFAAGATVTFGGAAATSVVVVNSTTITATTPAGSAGAVTVTVTVSGQSGSLPNGFTYVVVPTVSSISPNNGPVAGGTAVTITGTNFAAGATVTFGGTAATNVVVVNSTTITATTPAGSAGAVTVTVTVSGQSGSLTNGFTYNGAVAISFAQVASATPQSSTATVTVAYPGAQTAGDLNVVVVGWNDTTATVQSVKDSGGNNYSLAIGPTSGTALRQSIYYAPNIVGGANTVTVTFSQAAVDPDVRILEYRGVSAVDKTAGASGSSKTASSGSATTTSANELIFGANMVYTLTGAAGSGFTSRIITNPDGDIAEDKVVTTTGSNSATASLTSSGPWVMQMVTFK